LKATCAIVAIPSSNARPLFAVIAPHWKIRAAPTPEDVKRYTDELAEALFGPQAPLA